MTERFAVAVREEVWAGGRLVEWRLSHGEAVPDEAGILATDRADPALVEACEREMKRLRDAMPFRTFDARLVAEARSDGLSGAMVLTGGGCSIVTDPDHVSTDVLLLERSSARQPAGELAGWRGLPILWTGGSGAVLLHEAAGHPAEAGARRLEWPAWLSVHDGPADLLAGEAPPAFRRSSFRDVPLRRMSEVRVAQSGAPFLLPEERIEVFLVEGGAWDPLTDRVVVTVAGAEHVRGGERMRMGRFVLSEPREAVPPALAGAQGEPERYPGVICSREGHELFVASFAPLLLTVFA